MASRQRVASVLIEREPFGLGFDVRAPRPECSAEFRTIGEARAYADDIARRNGWRIENRTDEP